MRIAANFSRKFISQVKVCDHQKFRRCRARICLITIVPKQLKTQQLPLNAIMKWSLFEEQQCKVYVHRKIWIKIFLIIHFTFIFNYFSMVAHSAMLVYKGSAMFLH